MICIVVLAIDILLVTVQNIKENVDLFFDFFIMSHVALILPLTGGGQGLCGDRIMKKQRRANALLCFFLHHHRVPISNFPQPAFR